MRVSSCGLAKPHVRLSKPRDWQNCWAAAYDGFDSAGSQKAKEVFEVVSWDLETNWFVTPCHLHKIVIGMPACKVSMPAIHGDYHNTW